MFNKAATGTDVPQTHIHYHKVIATSCCKIALSWPIQHDTVTAKKGIQPVTVVMKIGSSIYSGCRE